VEIIIIVTACIGTLSLLVLIIASYAYIVNHLRRPDDPAREDFQPAALLLAPFTWPIYLVLGFFSLIIKFVLLIIEAFLFTLTLVIFTVVAILSRMLIPMSWLHRLVMKIGTGILRTNTSLIRLIRNYRGTPESRREFLRYS